MAASPHDDSPSEAMREAARFAREAARIARDQVKEEARRLRAEAHQVRRDVRDDARRARDDLRARRDAAREEERREWDEPGATVEQALDLSGITSIDVKQTAGRLSILPCGEGESPHVESTSSKAPPTLEVQRSGDHLRIEVRLSIGRIFRRRRGAQTAIRLTPGFERLLVDLGYGHATIEDFSLNLFRLHIGAGDARIRRIAATTEIDVGAGQVVVQDHAGRVSCDIGTGDARIDVAQPADGDYAVNVGMGQAELALAPGHAVHATVSSGIGKGEVSYPDAGDQATIRARVSTGVGRAAVIPRRPDDGSRPERTPPTRAERRRNRGTEAEEVRVLQLLEQGRITSQEAAELIAALQGVEPPSPDDLD